MSSLINMNRHTGFTITEIIFMVLIIGIVSVAAYTSYAIIKEKSADREAKASLALIQVAEGNYRMEKGFYYPNLSTTSVIADINSNLRLSLPVTSPQWAISLDSRVSGSEFATATRSGRTWKIYLPKGSSEIPTCSGAGCP